jgi:hypothetical protein
MDEGKEGTPSPPVRRDAKAKASALSATAGPSLFLSFPLPFDYNLIMPRLGPFYVGQYARGVVVCPTAYIEGDEVDPVTLPRLTDTRLMFILPPSPRCLVSPASGCDVKWGEKRSLRDQGRSCPFERLSRHLGGIHQRTARQPVVMCDPCPPRDVF